MLDPTRRTVSRLGFGGAPTGHFNYLAEHSPEHVDQRELAIAAIQHAADSGITYFDTAAAYGDGEGERIYGEALAGRVNSPADVLHANPPSEGPEGESGRPEPVEGQSSSEWLSSFSQRQKVQDEGEVVSRREVRSLRFGRDDKAPRTLRQAQDGVTTSPSHQSSPAGRGGNPLVPEHGHPPSNSLPHKEGEQTSPRLFIATKVSPKEADVRGSVERSLRNLRMDRIDLVQVHGGSYTAEEEDTVMRPGGMLDVLEKARDEGLIRHIGFTTENQNGAVDRFIESGRFEVMQIQYNLLYQHPYSPDPTFGSMFAAREAGMGIVTMRALAAGILQRWLKLVRPDDEFDYAPALLQFTLSNPLIDVALVGMRTPEEVDRNIAVLNDTDGRIDLDELHRKFV